MRAVLEEEMAVEVVPGWPALCHRAFAHLVRHPAVLRNDGIHRKERHANGAQPRQPRDPAVPIAVEDHVGGNIEVVFGVELLVAEQKHPDGKETAHEKVAHWGVVGMADRGLDRPHDQLPVQNERCWQNKPDKAKRHAHTEERTNGFGVVAAQFGDGCAVDVLRHVWPLSFAAEA